MYGPFLLPFKEFLVNFVNILPQATISYLCLNLAVTPIFIAFQSQLMRSVLSVLFFFINAALLLIIINLEYLGLAILLVYAGAIIMILLFVIMLVKLQEIEYQPFSNFSPQAWNSTNLTVKKKHTKLKTGFILSVLILGASILTYSCSAVIADLTTMSNGVSKDLVSFFNMYMSPSDIGILDESKLCYSKHALPRHAYQPPNFDTYAVMETNFTPWFLTYFNSILETKFQPLVLENEKSAITSTHTLFTGPSYNIDKWVLSLVSQFGHLSELTSEYAWLTPKLDPIISFPSTGNPLTNIEKLGTEGAATREWTYYPRIYRGIYDFPEVPYNLLRETFDSRLLYSAEVELKDQLVFPRTDLSNISLKLYTNYAPALVLASVCLFIAMILSFLLTDFKVKG